jgi:ketosteroid isomerase-like protein
MASSDDSNAILEIERRRRAALVAVDLDELDRLFAEDLIHVHSTGMKHTKAELLRHIEQKRAFLAIDRGDLQIRVEGPIAVITGTMTNRMCSRDGKAEILLHGFVTQVLRRNDEGWQFISFQLTPILDKQTR